MKLAFIVGSQKAADSNSEKLLELLKEQMQPQHEITTFYANKSTMSSTDLKLMDKCDALVFSFPQQEQGLPTHLCKCLKQITQHFEAIKKRDYPVYALCNTVRCDGIETENALQKMKIWCVSAGLTWGQGLGVGGSGVIACMEQLPLPLSPVKQYVSTLQEFAKNIAGLEQGEDMFKSYFLPQFLYKTVVRYGWHKKTHSSRKTPKWLEIQPVGTSNAFEIS